MCSMCLCGSKKAPFRGLGRGEDSIKMHDKTLIIKH